MVNKKMSRTCNKTFKTLGFTLITGFDQGGTKKVYNAMCSTCKKVLKNTTATRLENHKKVCDRKHKCQSSSHKGFKPIDPHPSASESDYSLSTSNAGSSYTLHDESSNDDDSDVVDEPSAIHPSENVTTKMLRLRKLAPPIITKKNLPIILHSYPVISLNIEIPMDSMEIVFDGDGNQVTTNNSDVNAGLLMEDQNNKTPKKIHPYFDKNKCNRLSRSSSLNLKSMCSPSPAETISSLRSSTSKSDSRASLSTLSPLSRSSSSCTNSKSRSYTMEKYMDRISSDEVERVNEALADLFFGCNIPFSVVESSHFKNFIDTIRPAYVPSIPKRKTLSGPLLDKAYEKSLTDCRSLIENDDSVLLLDGWKNTSNNSRTVVSMLHTADNKRVFVDAWDITGSSENSEKLEEIVDESVKIATEKFGSKPHAIVTDNAAAMLKMGRNVELWHSTCSSHTGNLLAKDIINESIISTMKTLLSKFKQADFERKIVDAGGSRIMTIADTRWCSYRDSAKCLLSNINIVRKLIIDKELDRIMLCNDTSDLIFDFQFFSDLEDFVKLSDPICELINKCQRGTFSIADATDLWLKLEILNAYRANFQKRIDMALNIYAKVAYYLHPQYDSKKLSEEDILEVKEFLIDHLDSKGLQDLCEFENGFGIFRKLLSRKDLDALNFWKTLQSHCPSLSTLALKLLTIPASSAQIERIFSNWSFVHSRLRNRLTFEKSKKLLHLYCTLKLRDNNSTDDY